MQRMIACGGTDLAQTWRPQLGAPYPRAPAIATEFERAGQESASHPEKDVVKKLKRPTGLTPNFNPRRRSSNATPCIPLSNHYLWLLGRGGHHNAGYEYTMDHGSSFSLGPGTFTTAVSFQSRSLAPTQAVTPVPVPTVLLSCSPAIVIERKSNAHSKRPASLKVSYRFLLERIKHHRYLAEIIARSKTYWSSAVENRQFPSR
jgi:hypothetical protein